MNFYWLFFLLARSSPHQPRLQDVCRKVDVSLRFDNFLDFLKTVMLGVCLRFFQGFFFLGFADFLGCVYSHSSSVGQGGLDYHFYHI